MNCQATPSVTGETSDGLRPASSEATKDASEFDELTVALAIVNDWNGAKGSYNDLVNRIAAAIRSERERCAYVADCHTGLWDHATAVNIAASIRSPDHVA